MTDTIKLSLTPEELEDKLARAAAAAESYRLTSVEQRAGWLAKAADNLENEADSVSKMITAEMGKTYRAAQDEVAKSVRGLRFYAEEGPGFLKALPGDGARVGGLRHHDGPPEECHDRSCARAGRARA